MKILTISDEASLALWDHYQPGRLDGYDLILACGDLPPSYLSFLVTMAKCPLLYVHGNHDGSYEQFPPEGCDCIDGRIVTYNGLRILGLGGCLRYHPGPYQYTEGQMRRRIARLRYWIWRQGGVDIVVTHAPPEGLGDGEDPAHWGFAALRELVEKYSPQYLVHGHVHMRYGHNISRVLHHGQTQIVNACERFEIQAGERDHRQKDHGQVVYKSPAAGKI